MNSFNQTQSASSVAKQQPLAGGPGAAAAQAPSAAAHPIPTPASAGTDTTQASAVDSDVAEEPGALSPVQKEARCYCW